MAERDLGKTERLDHQPAASAGHWQAGMRVGPYRLLRLLGSGGMGEVFLAERADGEFQLQVAIKLGNGDGDTETIRRLAIERRILASLRHPYIARFLGGDRLADGQPYLVMEYVDGVPINEHVAATGPSLDALLRLFLRVCQAVEHAHAHLVVHRDLKPANIMVDAQGDPRLLDFGIAQVLAAEGQAARDTASKLMTPAYATPEQVRGELVTTATDVYALGLILYELLTRQVAQDVNTTTRPSEWESLVCEQEVASLQARIVDFWPAAGDRARDLDLITRKALRKQPSERYASVAALAADLRAVLEYRPVSARAPSWIYLGRRALRRHRGWIGALGVLAILVIGGVAREAQLRQQAEQAAADARQQAERATAVLEFVREAFAAASPERSGAQLKVTDLLGDAARDSERFAASDPVLFRALVETLGGTMLAVGLYPGAETYARKALSLLEPLDVEDAPLIDILADAVAFQQRYSESVADFDRAYRLRRVAYGEDHPHTLVALGRLADIHSAADHRELAFALAEQVVEGTGRVHGEHSMAFAQALHNQGIVNFSRGRPDHALRAFSQAADVLRELPAEDLRNRRLAAALSMAVQVRVLAQPDAQALQWLAEVEQQLRALVGDRAVELYTIDHQRSLLGRIQGDLPAALAAAERSMLAISQAHGPTGSRRIIAGTNLGSLLCQSGRCAEGLGVLQETLELARVSTAPDSHRVLWLEAELALAAVHLGEPLDPARFEALALRAERALADRQNPTLPWEMRARLAEARMLTGDLEGGADALSAIADQLAQSYGWHYPSVRELRRKAGEAYVALGDTERAKPLLDLASATFEVER